MQVPLKVSKFGNPVAENASFSTEDRDTSLRTMSSSDRTASIDRGASRRDWKSPAAVSREHAHDHELDTLFELVRHMAGYLESLRDDGTADPEFSPGAKFAAGIPKPCDAAYDGPRAHGR